MNQPERQTGNGRPDLVRARERKGLTQEEAAELIGVAVTTWARWERGEQKMRPAYRVRIARAWHVPVEEVERWLAVPHPVAEPAPDVDVNGLAVGCCAESAARLWRWEIDTSRRQLLAALPFTPTVLGEWLLSWSFDPPVAAPGNVSNVRVGMSDVRAIQEAHEAFTRMDHQFGAGLVRPAVIDFLASKVAPLLRGRADDDVRTELFTAASQMTRLAGWMAFDLSRHGQAQQHFGQALKLAKQAEDGLTGAWVLATLAQQACDLSQRRWAIRLAGAAVEAADKAEAPSQMTAELLVRQARALAVLADIDGDRPDAYTIGEVGRLLTKAETAFARDTTGRGPSWNDSFDAAEMAAEVGYCWQLLGEHQRAVIHTEQALQGFGTDFPRSTQFNQIHAARSYLELGELDRALDYACQAVPATGTLASTRARTLMDDFTHCLKPYRSNRHVRDFEDYRHTHSPS
ncbi:helix-turn-helix transcriptional regulator [Nonomuraea sp. FMUSA5-5]|uniref:Helix-turn-helix transcriptional regulator n=1 Tax=Nonomuraea composti TaxID=2720023 RepID=A0ABX1BC90_9ACTN|nr:helix-turn-helix transcriptional regulator [Nonomuraea sp. FMUSA5-5]